MSFNNFLIFILLVVFSSCNNKENKYNSYVTFCDYNAYYSSTFIYNALDKNDEFLIKEYFHSMSSPNISDTLFFDRLWNLCDETNFFFGLMHLDGESLNSFSAEQKDTYKSNCVLVYKLYLINSNKKMNKYSNERNTSFQDWYFDFYQKDTLFNASNDSLMILNKINEFIPTL